MLVLVLALVVVVVVVVDVVFVVIIVVVVVVVVLTLAHRHNLVSGHSAGSNPLTGPSLVRPQLVLVSMNNYHTVPNLNIAHFATCAIPLSSVRGVLREGCRRPSPPRGLPASPAVEQGVAVAPPPAPPTVTPSDVFLGLSL